MKKLIVIDIVGLTKKHVDKISLPNISKILETGFYSSMIPSFPAVTCTVQASITTGFQPSAHGIISNGYYDKLRKEVSFWEQHDSLVKKPRIWDIIKKINPRLKTAVLFWQNSLYINSDIVITPKPIHLENQMIMWCYSKPLNYYEDLVQQLGEFDLKWYWGPFTSIKASQWIINAAKYTIEKHRPDLLFVYIPHLDYTAQKNGPNSNEFKQSIIDVDKIIGNFLDFLKSRNLTDYELIIHSEYSFHQVRSSVSPNVLLRRKGLLRTRKIAGKEYLDFELSKAFAMVDHQVAHVYVKNGFEDKVRNIFKSNENITDILDKTSQNKMHINHTKSGDLILCSNKDSWFNYYWWDDVKYAPPFAFTVDIHRKPGYDPLELFLDPATKMISQDASLIKGSHGCFEKENSDELPLFTTSLTITKPLKIIDVTQIAPTISNFFKINYNFPSKSVL